MTDKERLAGTVAAAKTLIKKSTKLKAIERQSQSLSTVEELIDSERTKGTIQPDEDTEPLE